MDFQVGSVGFSGTRPSQLHARTNSDPFKQQLKMVSPVAQRYFKDFSQLITKDTSKRYYSRKLSK